MPDTVECSRCGTPVAPDGDSIPPFCPNCGAQLEAAQNSEPPVDYTLIAPPPDSKIEIIEATNDRLVLSIPGGGKLANVLVCFGTVWLLITAGMTVGFTFVELGDAFFWLIGIFILVWAIRMKFTRGYLYLSAGRAVHQRILFNRKKNTEIAVDASSYAQLVEAYRKNDSPVYRIEIQGTDGKIKYGTGMDPEYKQWYVETINRFIAFQYQAAGDETPAAAVRDPYGGLITPPTCPACGRKIPDEKDTHCSACGARLNST